MTKETNPSLETPVHTDTLKVLIAHSASGENPTRLDGNEIAASYFSTDQIKSGEPIGFPQLKDALSEAKTVGAHLVFGVDEAENKLCMAVQKHSSGAFNLLNVHQTAVLIAYLLVSENEPESVMIMKSVPVTAMLEKVTLKNGQLFSEVPSEKLPEVWKNSTASVVFAVNENQQFFGNPYASVNDLIMLLVEKEKELRLEGKTLLDLLMELYKRYGYYQEKVFAVDIKAEQQGKHFDKLMEKYRKSPPELLGFHKLQQVVDFRKQTIKNIEARKTRPMEGESVDMIRFVYSENVAVTIAPQEGKMLFYISINGSLGGNDSYNEIKEAYNVRMIKFMQALNAITQ